MLSSPIESGLKADKALIRRYLGDITIRREGG